MKHFFTLSISSLLAITLTMAQTVSEKMSFEGIESIKIKTSGGNCLLQKGSGSTVVVEFTHTFDDDEFEPIVEKNGSTLLIKEEFNSSFSSGNSEWTLTIPDNLDINFGTGSGDLEASDLTLNLKSTLGSGDIRFQNVRGEQSVTTGSGDLIFKNSNGRFTLTTGSGDVRFDGVEGSTDVNVGSGRVEINRSRGDYSINVGSGDIQARDVRLTGESYFNSGSGDAEVSLASKLVADIGINSGSGNATLDFDGAEISGTVTMKANKRNGDIVAPFKFDSETEEGSGRNIHVKKTVRIGNEKIRIKVGTGSGTAEISK